MILIVIVDYNIKGMLKVVLSKRFVLNNLLRYTLSTFANNKTTNPLFKDTEQSVPAYKILLQNSIDLTPKTPTPYLLYNLRPRSLFKIMSQNHALHHEKVLQAHIECLYALTNRGTPLVEASAIFTDFIFHALLDVSSRSQVKNASGIKRSLNVVMKPTLLSKTAKICHSISHLYNEYMRTMMSVFIIRSILFSKQRQKEKILKIKQLHKTKTSIQKGNSLKLEDNVQITTDNLKQYFKDQMILIEDEYVSLTLIDILYGAEYVLCKGYFSEQLLSIVVNTVLSSNFQNSSTLQEVILKLKVIIHLEKYKNYKGISDNNNKIFSTIYGSLISTYFNMLSNQLIYQDELQSDKCLIQTSLLTQFLNQDHHKKAKNIYLKIVKAILNTYLNGLTNVEVKKLKGIFQIILIMCTHEDTQAVHEILSLLEKAMVLYPSIKFDRLEIHTNVAQKYGFKSHVFAEYLLKSLTYSKNKIQKNKILIHKVHQQMREIHLASKYLTYLKIAEDVSKSDFEMVHSTISKLFVPNIWQYLDQTKDYRGYLSFFFTTSSYGQSIYFRNKQAFPPNATYEKRDRLKIEKMAQLASVKHISRHINSFRAEIEVKKQSLAFDHEPFWRHNHHARIASVLELAIHQHHYLAVTSSGEESIQFTTTFVKKVLQNPAFYTLIKQNICYPTVMNSLLKLQRIAYNLDLSLFQRDMEAIKKLFSQQFIKLRKNSQQFKVEYQQNLENIQYNKVFIPYYNDIYSISGVVPFMNQSIYIQICRRYMKEKQALRMELETFYKFSKQEGTSIFMNYFEFPHFADLRIVKSTQKIIVLFRFSNDKTNFLNHNQIDLQIKSQKYWVSRKNTVIIIKSQQQIEKFLKNIKASEKSNNVEMRRSM